MKEYTIIYVSGDSEIVESPDKSTLIREHFKGDGERFLADVARLKWTSLSTEYVEDIQSGTSHANIFTADVNPYGWRV